MAAKKKDAKRASNAPPVRQPAAADQNAAPAMASKVDTRFPDRDGPEVRVRQLELELRATRDELQSTIRELQNSNQELQATNEEIISTNDQLQVANEALHAAKEETSAVNTGLQEKLDELEPANDNMSNLLNCTDIATIFLDTNLRIKLFTPASFKLFSLIAADIGRRLAHMMPKFDDPTLLADAETVLKHLEPRETEIATADGCWWLRRIVPYRTRSGRIDGVVITFVDVTEPKRATDAVVRRLASIVETSADAIASQDLSGIVRTWNQGAERLFGYSAAEMIGHSIRVIVPHDRSKEWAQAMAKLREGQHVQQMESERLRKDGRRVPVVVTYSPIRNSEGKITSVSAIVRDITDRKRAEIALRASEERFRLMADAAPVMIWLSGTDKLCTWFNKTWLDFTGRTMAREIGNGWCEGVHAEDYEYCQKTYEAHFDARRPFTMEYRLRRYDGDYRWILDNGIPLLDHDGTFVGYIGSCVDITDRKRAEDAVRDREERLRAILNAANDAIITIDQRGVIQSANAATERMFGYSPGELTGENVSLLMPSPYCEMHNSYLASYHQTGEKHVIGVTREVLARRKDGSIFPSELSVSEIEHLKLFTGIHRDLTERKELERDVVEAASLEQRRIGQDLHDSVAQELTALQMLARDLTETLQIKPARAPPLARQIGDGLMRSQRELRIVLRGLLPVAVDAEGLMSALADLAERTQQEGKVTCRFDCPEPVSVADNLTATHLFLIAQEAVHNAVKHGKARAVVVSLEANKALILSVQDDGIGMAASRIDMQGMGLRIMRNRAAVIGAELTIEPAKSTGTLVRCVLTRTNDEPKKVP